MSPDCHVSTQTFSHQQGMAQHLRHLEEVLAGCHSAVGTPLARGKVSTH